MAAEYVCFCGLPVLADLVLSCPRCIIPRCRCTTLGAPRWSPTAPAAPTPREPAAALSRACIMSMPTHPNRLSGCIT